MNSYSESSSNLSGCSEETRGNTSPQGNVIRDSRPDIIAWPTPPNASIGNNNSSSGNSEEHGSEEPTKLLSILKVASSSKFFAVTC